MLAPRPTPKLEDHPSSAVRDCLFNLFTATLHIGGRSSIRNLRTRHAVVTGTHIHGFLFTPTVNPVSLKLVIFNLILPKLSYIQKLLNPLPTKINENLFKYSIRTAQATHPAFTIKASQLIM